MLKGKRKFIIIIITIIIAISFRLCELINGKEMTELISATVSAFMASNVVEHITDTIKKKINGVKK